MSCKPLYLGGWGTCKNVLKKTAGIVIQEKGNTFTDATITSSAAWQTAVADDSSSVRDTLPFDLLDFTNTTDEVTINTTPLGHSYKDGDPIPKATAFLKCGVYDYNWLHDLEGQEFELFPFFQGNSFWATRTAAGALKGFRCTLATRKGLPPEDKTQSFPLYINFSDPEEFENIVVVTPENWRFSDLLSYAPAGLNIYVSTAYTGGNVVVYATKVGTGEAMTTLTETTDWEIMRSSAEPTVAVTVVAHNGLGYYTLTVKKDTDGTATNLAATDWVEIQAHDDDGTNLTYVSQGIRFYGGA